MNAGTFKVAVRHADGTKGLYLASEMPDFEEARQHVMFVFPNARAVLVAVPKQVAA